MPARAPRPARRLLLNAEPFGYGPAAAVATLFPHLRPRFETIGFVGKRHTLDLQRELPYDELYDLSPVARDARAAALAPIFARFDLLLTAMDDEMAQLAQDAGLEVHYYDALAWYWPQIPTAARSSALVLAQDFFGVRERLARAAFAGRVEVVPPLIPARVPSRAREHVLVNLGGLQNPHWPLDGVVAYARAVVRALRGAIPAGERTVIAASASVARQLADEGVRCYARSEMEGLAGGARAAFMTPGLGNIYDAAVFDLPTAWLPPANDSQGQQLALLQEHGLHDAAIDWSDLGGAIDPRGEQRAVLGRIASAASALAGSADQQARLGALADAHWKTLRGRAGSRTARLVTLFGSGGAERVAALVAEEARVG